MMRAEIVFSPFFFFNNTYLGKIKQPILEKHILKNDNVHLKRTKLVNILFPFSFTGHAQTCFLRVGSGSHCQQGLLDRTWPSGRSPQVFSALTTSSYLISHPFTAMLKISTFLKKLLRHCTRNTGHFYVLIQKTHSLVLKYPKTMRIIPENQ